MQLHPQKFNRMTLIKAAVCLVVILTVLITSAISIAFMSKSAAYDAALGAYEGWIGDLAAAKGESVKNLENGNHSGDEYSAVFGGEFGGFEGVAVVAEASGGRVVYCSSDLLSVDQLLSDKGFSIPEDSSVQVLTLGDKDYAFAAKKVGERTYICGFIDFSASAKAMKNLNSSLLTISIFSVVLVACAFITYIVMTGLNERGHRYRYKFTTDSEGRIVRSNAMFKEDFPQTVRIHDNLAHFGEDNLSAIKLTNFEEDEFIACSTKKLTNGNFRLKGDKLHMPYNSQATQPREVMREAYTALLPKGKAFLIGRISFDNLHNIKEMFGREFAETVHGILYAKVSKIFTYVYDLDLYQLGVLFPNGKNYEALLQDLRDYVNDWNEAIKIESNVVIISVKCGFAICDNYMAERNFDYAMTAAEAALKRATEDKLKNYYVFHGTEIKHYAKYFVNYDIRQMLADNMFEMEYQPQYGIKEGRIVGFEALFRVKKSANMTVNIFDLISYAERTGNMVVLGEFIFDTAMRFAKRVEDKNVKVSLNVSPIQLMQAGFCDNFLAIFNKYELKPGVICVEITESFLVQNFDDAVQKLEILREHGIEVHLDDFGTRYSSLLYLKKLPVSVIKIDREFIIDIKENDLDKSIVEMIVKICRTHDFKCITEGVETREQYDVLKSLGVDIIQGWIIGKSAPADIAARLIDTFVLK